MDLLLKRLRRIPLAPASVQFRNQARLDAWLSALPAENRSIIGRSRQGQPLFGVRLGTGKRSFSILAGCHADEPVGPMTAQCLPAVLQEHFPALLREYQVFIVPQINPDGADRNRPWFRNPLDFATCVETAQREAPGDDIEFGFGEGPDCRPECAAAMDFLRGHAPFTGHCSLHGMTWSEGLWYLIGPSWKDHAPLQDALHRLSAAEGLPLHDIERHGEKGFHRIAPGFCTTPNHRDMAAFFRARNDEATARLFRPSSMEWIASLGGNPLCLVSELPLFLMDVPTDPGHPPLVQVRDAIALLAGRSTRERRRALAALAAHWRIAPLPLLTQIRLQLGMIAIAMTLGLEEKSP